jgi:glycosyltransferase involved in cell wall biosynthesis
MSPKITICIPTFNRSDLLDQALQSVAMQTVKPYEVLIVDNASTDNTKDVVKKYEMYGFRYIENKTNVGMVENWNVGIRNARGDYISFLHNDDLIAPTWYKEWSDVISQHSARFYTSSIAIIDQFNKPDTRNFVFVGLAPNRFGLGFHAGNAVEHCDGTVEHSQRTLYFNGKVDVTGRVDNVDGVVFPETSCSGSGNGNAALFFLLHPVHGSFALMNFANFVIFTGIKKNAFGNSGFTGIDVGNDTNISNSFKRICACHD